MKMTALLASMLVATLTPGCRKPVAPQPASETTDTRRIDDQVMQQILDAVAKDELDLTAPGATFNCSAVPVPRFVAGQTGFQRTYAYQLARASFSAYFPMENVEKVKTELGFDRVTKVVDSQSDTQAYVFSNGGSVVVAFRGTQTSRWKDVLTDISLLQTDGLWGDIHRGFRGAFISIRDELMPVMRSHGAASKNLFITGHSLGGALATLLAGFITYQELRDALPAALSAKDKQALMLSRGDPRHLDLGAPAGDCTKTIDTIRKAKPDWKGPKAVKGLYTFGAPRVGNHAFASCFDAALKSRSFRVVNSADVVPMVPRAGYEHTGQMAYIDRNNALTENVSGPEMFLDRVRATISDVAHLMNDHLTYVEDIARVFDKSCPER